MTLQVCYPTQKIEFYGLGEINFNAQWHTRFSKLFGENGQVSIDVAKVITCFDKYVCGGFSYYLDPSILMTTEIIKLALNRGQFFNSESSTLVTCINIARYVLVSAYLVKSAKDGSLQALSDHLWATSKKAGEYLNQIEKGNFTHAEFKEPITISELKGTWGILNYPISVFNALISKLHAIYLWVRNSIVGVIPSNQENQ